MNPIEALFSEPFGQTLGWTLLHFVWQGGLVALTVALILHLLRRRTAQARYAVACGALALLMVLPIVTFSLLLPDPVDGPATVPASPAAASAPTAEAATLPDAAPVTSLDAPVAWQQRAAAALAGALPWLVLLWMTGVLALSMRYLAGWSYSVRLRRRGARMVGQRWQDQLARLTQQMGVRRRVRLVSSTLVKVPTVAGWLRPVILMPVSVFTGLSPRQIEMIIAHELAHIRRHDYLINLMQAACETVLFYHPAVWWVSQRIRIEREHCCDDVVVSVCGDAFTYAAALTKMEEARQTPRLALAATGGSLLGRVRRLLGSPDDVSPRAARWLAGLVVLSTFVLSLFLSSTLSGLWTQTHAWIIGTEASEQPGGQLFITTENDQGVHVETFKEDGTSNTMILRGSIRVQMRSGSHFTVDYPHEARPEKRGNATIFTAPLTMEIWHHERKLSHWKVPEGSVVFEPSDVRSSSELVTVDGGSAIGSVPRPLARSGYEKTALRLEELIFEDRSTSVQLEALDELRALPARGSVPSLIRIAETHPAQRVSMEAIQWVGRLGDAYVVPALEGIVFDDRSLPVQMEALDALRNLPDKMGLPWLIKIAQKHPRSEMRNEAVQWIGRLGDEAARVTLERILYEDADPSVQREAFDALANLPYGLNTRTLRQILETHPNESVRREAANGLTETEYERFMEARRQRARASQMQPQPNPHADTAERLKALVFDQDENTEVHLEALEALANLTSQASLPSLRNIAQTHPNEQIRKKASHHLETVETAFAAEQQENAQWSKALDDLKDGDVEQRLEAVQILGASNTRRFFSVLTDLAFGDESLEVQREALDALRDLGGLEGMARVARIARKHLNATMRAEAVQSMDAMSVADRRDVLEEVIFRDESLEVRMEALDQLHNLPVTFRAPILARVVSRPGLPDALRREAADMLEDAQ